MRSRPPRARGEASTERVLPRWASRCSGGRVTLPRCCKGSCARAANGHRARRRTRSRRPAARALPHGVFLDGGSIAAWAARDRSAGSEREDVGGALASPAQDRSSRDRAAAQSGLPVVRAGRSSYLRIPPDVMTLRLPWRGFPSALRSWRIQCSGGSMLPRGPVESSSPVSRRMVVCSFERVAWVRGSGWEPLHWHVAKSRSRCWRPVSSRREAGEVEGRARAPAIRWRR